MDVRSARSSHWPRDSLLVGFIDGKQQKISLVTLNLEKNFTRLRGSLEDKKEMLDNKGRAGPGAALSLMISWSGSRE